MLNYYWEPIGVAGLAFFAGLNFANRYFRSDEQKIPGHVFLTNCRYDFLQLFHYNSKKPTWQCRSRKPFEGQLKDRAQSCKYL